MSIFARVAGLGLLAAVFLAGSTLMNSKSGPMTAPVAQAAEPEHHPAIHRALRELRDARKELKEAKHDFDGHREDALRAVDKAIEQLDVCLHHDR
jgi:hypothetical protein